MPHDRRAPDDPAEWLNRARSNLERAKADVRLEGVYLEDLCFDAQQAAEKAIKALLIRLGIRFPYVHDIGYLLSLVETAGDLVADEVMDAARLTRFAAATRYPGAAEALTSEEYEWAVAKAAMVIRWVESLFERNLSADVAEDDSG